MIPSLNKNKWNGWLLSRFIVCVQFWVMFPAGNIHTQELPVRFEHKSFENGLCQNRVQSIFQDSRGYHIPQKNQYMYKVEGLEDDWNHANEWGSLTYAHKGPGAYHFRVKGANSHSAWDEMGISVNLRMTPPFWKTPLCSVLLVISSISLLYVIHRYQLRLLRIRTQTLESEINKRTMDLFTIVIIQALSANILFNKYQDILLF